MAAAAPRPTRPVPAPFEVTVVPDREKVVLVPSGELDLQTVDRLDGEVRDLRSAGFEHVVIDLRRLDFVDSSGLRLLLSLRNTALRRGHRLELIQGGDQVRRLFVLTRTQSAFDWAAA